MLNTVVFPANKKASLPTNNDDDDDDGLFFDYTNSNIRKKWLWENNLLNKNISYLNLLI